MLGGGLGWVGLGPSKVVGAWVLPVPVYESYPPKILGPTLGWIDGNSANSCSWRLRKKHEGRFSSVEKCALVSGFVGTGELARSSVGADFRCMFTVDFVAGSLMNAFWSSS